jgi:hypothetical protein
MNKRTTPRKRGRTHRNMDHTPYAALSISLKDCAYIVSVTEVAGVGIDDCGFSILF